MLAQNWCVPQNNDLKWPKIKQVATSKLCYNKFNRLISPVPQNKVGLTRAKASYTDFTLIKTFKCEFPQLIPGWFCLDDHIYIVTVFEDHVMILTDQYSLIEQ